MLQIIRLLLFFKNDLYLSVDLLLLAGDQGIKQSGHFRYTLFYNPHVRLHGFKGAAS